MVQSTYVRWFSEIGLDDVPLVGGKNASLGELYSALSAQDIRVPNGFAIIAKAYRDATANAWDTLHSLLDKLDKTNVERLKTRAAKARRIVYEATDCAELRAAITQLLEA